HHALHGFSDDAGCSARHAKTRVWPDRECEFRNWAARKQHRLERIWCCEGGDGWNDASGCTGNGTERNHDQRRGAGMDCDRFQHGIGTRSGTVYACRPCGDARRSGCSGVLPCVARGRVHHGAIARGRWRQYSPREQSTALNQFPTLDGHSRLCVPTAFVVFAWKMRWSSMRRIVLPLLLGLLCLAHSTLVQAQEPSNAPAAPERPTPEKARAKIGVALEGGGALGLAHIGVLQWFEDHHIPVDYVAGTSMGGLVGGLYATGKSPDELKKLVEAQSWDMIIGGATPFEDLSYRRKEDGRAYPNKILF